ncbi:hypothetical protein OG799_11745 [Micromonospora sp. NBC_00898]|nr:hypothetical protein OG799_11745 [Micromonospora sp. NBC_00898]
MSSGGHGVGEFLTEAKDHGVEIRCYLRDPNGLPRLTRSRKA